jgi:hypothetical protein
MVAVSGSPLISLTIDRTDTTDSKSGSIIGVGGEEVTPYAVEFLTT